MTRTAVVTGGGTGIGRATAAALAADGLEVVITGRRKDVLDRAVAELGRGVRAVPFDATVPAEIEAALPELPQRVEVLVNNAGGNTDLSRPEPRDLAGLRAAWLANLEANLVSAVLVTAALTPRLADGGRVVTLGSIAAAKGAAGYGAAKAGGLAWNAELAFRLGGRGITANVVAPGLVEETEFFGDGLPEQRRTALVAQTATGRAGRGEDVAATIAFLASAGAGHITGQVVHVNGGAHLGG
ncbi:3-oxoacyl-ACP reductase [Spongiactinospora rosea]|uniref:3-oxoacyl-ACP reductase n=1 Tax=Spongiactinospora rosea TaxID=2248750 RepID=A0A366LZI1_9ACTN|nr:SDR family oxidoreductase [Spongiactinospora rosea]RBQ19388.1 3-oxoacyl-ACP reductase [Spongiactinospora rosea]